MAVMTQRVSLNSDGNCDIRNITDEVAEAVWVSGVINGTVTVFLAGSTAGISTIEFEGGVIRDLEVMWDRLVPKEMTYQHDRAWGDGNGHSHVRASLLGPSLVVPFGDGRLFLGTWQQIILIDFDNQPRIREIILQIMGE